MRPSLDEWCESTEAHKLLKKEVAITINNYSEDLPSSTVEEMTRMVLITVRAFEEQSKRISPEYIDELEEMFYDGESLTGAELTVLFNEIKRLREFEWKYENLG